MLGQVLQRQNHHRVRPGDLGCGAICHKNPPTQHAPGLTQAQREREGDVFPAWEA